MFMGKNTTKTRYETVVQLLLLAAAVLTPVLLSILMDLELFSVSKTMFIALCSSINPWLYPPYVYILINFIIFFIFASSYIRSNTTTVFNPVAHDHNQSLDNSFIESSLVSPNLELGSLTDDDPKLHTLENKIKDDNDDPKAHDDVEEHAFKDRNLDVGRPEEVVDKRELRKSKTFHEGSSRWNIGRRERYVKILSQDELDRRVEAFISRFKQEKNFHKLESDKGLEFGDVY